MYIAIGCMLAAAVLGLVSFVLTLRSDLASSKNSITQGAQYMSDYTDYNKYQNSVLWGEDVMALISEYAGSGVAVYIDNLYDEGSGSLGEFYMDASFSDDSTVKIEDVSFTALENGEISAYAEADEYLNYFDEGVSRDATYFSYVVVGEYSYDDIKAITSPTDSPMYSEVSAIYVVCLDGTSRLTLAEGYEEWEKLGR